MLLLKNFFCLHTILFGTPLNILLESRVFRMGFSENRKQVVVTNNVIMSIRDLKILFSIKEASKYMLKS